MEDKKLDFEYFCRLTEQCILQGCYKSAHACYDEALKLNPNTEASFKRLGNLEEKINQNGRTANE